MKLNRFFSISAVGLLAAFGSSALAATVVIDRVHSGSINGPDYGGDTVAGVNPKTGDGGEFTLVPTDASILSLYSPKALAQNNAGVTGFESFCMEVGLSYPVPPGLPTNTLNYLASPNFINAPVYQPGMVLTVGTAWLYSQFAAGTLAGYDYTDISVGNSFPTHSPRADDAAYLQAAFWYLENQTGFANTPSSYGGSANPYMNDLFAAATVPVASGGLGLSGTSGIFNTNAAGGFGVYVLNIGDPGTYQYQAQLVLGNAITVPDGGMTVVLLGAAAGGLALVRRKLFA